jgi:hypothetical protein
VEKISDKVITVKFFGFLVKNVISINLEDAFKEYIIQALRLSPRSSDSIRFSLPGSDD